MRKLKKLRKGGDPPEDPPKAPAKEPVKAESLFKLPYTDKEEFLKYRKGDLAESEEIIPLLRDEIKQAESENDEVSAKSFKEILARHQKTVDIGEDYDKYVASEKATPEYKDYEASREFHKPRVQWLLDNIQSPAYKKRLQGEGLPESDVEKRLSNIRDTGIKIGRTNEFTPAYFDKDLEREVPAKTEVQSLKQASDNSDKRQIGEAGIHEVQHNSTYGERDMSTYAKELYQKSFKKGWMNKDEQRYFSNPSERDARKKVLDYDLERLGIKKYGDEFKEEHYNRLLEEREKGTLNKNSEEFLDTTDPAYMNEIMNKVAANTKVSMPKVRAGGRLRKYTGGGGVVAPAESTGTAPRKQVLLQSTKTAKIVDELFHPEKYAPPPKMGKHYPTKEEIKEEKVQQGLVDRKTGLATGKSEPDYNDPITMLGSGIGAGLAKGVAGLTGKQIAGNIARATLDEALPFTYQKRPPNPKKVAAFNKEKNSSWTDILRSEETMDTKDAENWMREWYEHPETQRRLKAMNPDLDVEAGLKKPLVESQTKEYAKGYFSHLTKRALVSKKYTNEGLDRVQTGVHELTHQLTKGNQKLPLMDKLLLKMGVAPVNVDRLPHLTPAQKKEIIDDNGYFTNPTEIHARINQIRQYTGIAPDERMSAGELRRTLDEMVDRKILDHRFRDRVDVPMFSHVMNKMYTPAGVVVGAAAAGAKAASTEPEQKRFGGRLRKYTEGGKVEGDPNPLTEKLLSRVGTKVNQKVLDTVEEFKKKDPKHEAYNCIGSACSLLNESGVKFPQYYSNLLFSQDFNQGNLKKAGINRTRTPQVGDVLQHNNVVRDIKIKDSSVEGGYRWEKRKTPIEVPHHSQVVARVDKNSDGTYQITTVGANGGYDRYEQGEYRYDPKDYSIYRKEGGSSIGKANFYGVGKPDDAPQISGYLQNKERADTTYRGVPIKPRRALNEREQAYFKTANEFVPTLMKKFNISEEEARKVSIQSIGTLNQESGTTSEPVLRAKQFLGNMLQPVRGPESQGLGRIKSELVEKNAEGGPTNYKKIKEEVGVKDLYDPGDAYKAVAIKKADDYIRLKHQYKNSPELSKIDFDYRMLSSHQNPNRTESQVRSGKETYTERYANQYSNNVAKYLSNTVEGNPFDYNKYQSKKMVKEEPEVPTTTVSFKKGGRLSRNLPRKEQGGNAQAAKDAVTTGVAMIPGYGQIIAPIMKIQDSVLGKIEANPDGTLRKDLAGRIAAVSNPLGGVGDIATGDFGSFINRSTWGLTNFRTHSDEMAEQARKKKIADSISAGTANFNRAETGGFSSRGDINASMKMGGAIKTGKIKTYYGDSHEAPSGGIPIDQNGNPNRGKAVALVEGGETAYNLKGEPVIFSDTLKPKGYGGTFADVSKRIKNNKVMLDRLARIQLQAAGDSPILAGGGDPLPKRGRSRRRPSAVYRNTNRVPKYNSADVKANVLPEAVVSAKRPPALYGRPPGVPEVGGFNNYRVAPNQPAATPVVPNRPTSFHGKGNSVPEIGGFNDYQRIPDARPANIPPVYNRQNPLIKPGGDNVSEIAVGAGQTVPAARTAATPVQPTTPVVPPATPVAGKPAVAKTSKARVKAAVQQQKLTDLGIKAPGPAGPIDENVRWDGDTPVETPLGTTASSTSGGMPYSTGSIPKGSFATSSGSIPYSGGSMPAGAYQDASIPTSPGAQRRIENMGTFSLSGAGAGEGAAPADKDPLKYSIGDKLSAVAGNIANAAMVGNYKAGAKAKLTDYVRAGLVNNNQELSDINNSVRVGQAGLKGATSQNTSADRIALAAKGLEAKNRSYAQMNTTNTGIQNQTNLTNSGIQAANNLTEQNNLNQDIELNNFKLDQYSKIASNLSGTLQGMSRDEKQWGLDQNKFDTLAKGDMISVLSRYGIDVKGGVKKMGGKLKKYVRDKC